MKRTQSRPATLVAACLLTSALCAALSWPAGVGPGGLLSAWASRPPAQSLPLVLSLAVLALSVWLAVVLCLGVTARLPGGSGGAAARLLSHVAPSAVRRALGVTLGATTVLSVAAGAAQATPPANVVAHAVQAVPSLDRPVAMPDLDRPAITSSTSSPSMPVTVHTGDSLWRIAARALPRGSSQAAIERSWHQWYRSNRALIGADPDVLQPGQQLTPPRTQETP